VFPFFYSLSFGIYWFVNDLGLGTGFGTDEVVPLMGNFYCLLEVCLKDGLVGAIGVKPGDVGRELFNDGSGRHRGHSGEW
jgi:hypothetical protein